MCENNCESENTHAFNRKAYQKARANKQRIPKINHEATTFSEDILFRKIYFLCICKTCQRRYQNRKYLLER